MRSVNAFFLFTGLCFIGNAVVGQPNTPKDFRKEIELCHQKIASALKEENIEMLVEHFDKEIVCMPEFQPTIKGKNSLKEYYSEIFHRRQYISFEKKISEIIPMQNNIVEIGIFTTIYKTREGVTNTLKGKYLNIWTIQKNGNILLKAESFGYIHAVDNPQSHVVTLSKELSNNKFSQQTQINHDLGFQLTALNTLMEKSVQTRDGNLRADFFTEDAIFMPFADSLKIGMKSIRTHLIAYNSYPVVIDTISIYNEYFEACGEYVIEYPRFYVKWHTSDLAGAGSGKGIRIWKREKNCSFKLYREIGIHDHIE